MKPLITAPGAYSDISNEDYHRHPSLCWGPSISSSGLKTLLTRSPRHYWWDSPMNPSRPPEKDKPHFNVGKAAHDMLLLSERWPEAYHVLPDGFNGNATKAQAAWHAEREAARDAGKCILTFDQAETVMAMAASLRANPFANASLAKGESEVTLVWKDQLTGVILRARPDFLPDSVRDAKAAVRAQSDVKTAADGSKDAFRRAIYNFGYHMSAALYWDGIKACFGAAPTHWQHIVIEKEPPHVVALYPLPAEDLARGRMLNRAAIDLYARCLDADRWPGYADEPEEVGLPGWARKQIDEGVTPEGLAWSEAA